MVLLTTDLLRLPECCRLSSVTISATAAHLVWSVDSRGSVPEGTATVPLRKSRAEERLEQAGPSSSTTALCSSSAAALREEASASQHRLPRRDTAEPRSGQKDAAAAALPKREVRQRPSETTSARRAEPTMSTTGPAVEVKVTWRLIQSAQARRGDL
jgi:hypothetical protein